MANENRWRAHRPKMVEQQNEALRLWMSGLSYREIAEELGVSSSTAYSRVQTAIDAHRPHADFDRYRRTQLAELAVARSVICLLYTSPSPRDATLSRMPSSA